MFLIIELLTQKKLLFHFRSNKFIEDKETSYFIKYPYHFPGSTVSTIQCGVRSDAKCKIIAVLKNLICGGCSGFDADCPTAEYNML